MIIDYGKDCETALQHQILDAETGQPLPMDGAYSGITYADDEKGVLRISLGRPAWKNDPHTPLSEDEFRKWIILEQSDHPFEHPWRLRDDAPLMCAAWREEKRPIRIVRKELSSL